MIARQFLTYTRSMAPAPSRLGIFSIEAWPAAGGGLLTGIAEPALAGTAPLRAPVKTVFLRLDAGGAVVCLIPYVGLEPEARSCAAALIAHELSVSETSLTIAGGGSDRGVVVADLHPTVERSLQALAAATRSLLVAAAAENWGLSARDCEAVDGEVHGPGRSVRYRDIAPEAALAAIPVRVTLRCGRGVRIAQARYQGIGDTSV